jgi:penicillin-binding protein 1C
MSDSVADEDKKELAKRFRRLISSSNEENISIDHAGQTEIEKEASAEHDGDFSEEVKDENNTPELNSGVADTSPLQDDDEIRIDHQDETAYQQIESVEEQQALEPEPLVTEGEIPHEPESSVSEVEIPHEPGPSVSEEEFPHEPEPSVSEEEIPHEPEPMVSEEEIPHEPEPSLSEAEISPEPEPSVSEAEIPHEPEPSMSEEEILFEPKPSVREDETPHKTPPAIDEYGMPIPRKTQGNSFQQGSNVRSSVAQPRQQTAYSQYKSDNRKLFIKEDSLGASRLSPRRKRSGYTVTPKEGIGCVFRMVLIALLAGIIVLLIGGSFVLYEYYQIAATLPSVADLQQRASTFETTRIFDRDGNLLYEILDPSAGRRTFITLDKISPVMVAATIATEDKSFYSHPGFDWTAILRAFWQNFTEKGTVSGASTITQQLARSLLLSPEERTEQSYMRKVREALLAAEITRRYSKDQILELYLNEFYYGNFAYGVEAAAETYFNTTADRLDLAQASFLAGLPQAPSVYDVYHNRTATRERQKQVLTLMYEASNEENCIYVSNSPQKVCVDAQTAVAAYTELETYEFNPPDVQMRYPHWVTYVRSLLEDQFDAQTIYRSGFSVYTTLDPNLQDEAERLVKQQVDSLAAYDASDGALVALLPSTGEILAMVGSADFYNDAIDGQVNMATSPTRQPGSSFKPITYIAAFEKGWTPSTLIWDVPSEFPPSGDPNDPRPPYKPVNYDGRFHGPVTVRSALANSYNIPAVKTLQFVGIYDNPDTPNEDGVLSVARRLGITSLSRDDYGLSLTLGGGEVSLLEMTEVFSVIANGGNRVPPVAISKILDHDGNVVYEYQPEPGEQVIRPEHTFLISSILSDNEARTPMFGANSALNLPFPAAAKTGTSNDFRDNWTLGYTPDIAVGVWVGNADYSPMKDISGLTGAAPIWSEFMQYAIQRLTGGNPTPFFKPSGIVDRVICAVSGTEPSQWCPNQRSEYFAADQLPLPSSQDLWSKVVLDTWTGFRASDACKDFTKEEFALNVTDPWAIGWIQNDAQGKAWAEDMGFNEPIRFAPSRDCQANDPHPVIEFSTLTEGQTITVAPLEIFAKIDVTSDFKDYSLSYGLGDNPVEWKTLIENSQPVSQSTKIFVWDLKDIPQGITTLKLTMNSIRGGYAEKKIHLNLMVSTPTPTITPTSTLTPTATPTPTLTLTPTLTSSPIYTQTVTPSDTPTQTTIPEMTSTPTDTPPPDTTKP